MLDARPDNLAELKPGEWNGRARTMSVSISSARP
jgi:hypothetical protein